MLTPPRAVVRRDGGLYALERTLRRRGFARIAGADEAGRGACAGPLAVAAVVLPPGPAGEVPGLADSKLLTPAAREQVYHEVVARAEAYAVVVIDAADVDARGLHRCNLDGMRRALGRLAVRPDYVLTDGFGVDGLGVPGLAVWKGDQVAACIAAASVLAKVTRDRLMVMLHERYPQYEFAQHKGYVTPGHSVALRTHGPCPEHRTSYLNVAAAAAGRAVTATGPDVGDNGQVEDVIGMAGYRGEGLVRQRDERAWDAARCLEAAAIERSEAGTVSGRGERAQGYGSVANAVAGRSEAGS